MTVDFDREIWEMFKKNISLCRYADKHRNRLASLGLYSHSRHCPEFCFGDGPQGLTVLRKMLSDEQSFENPLFHLLFKAFAYGEYRFVRTFVPQNSNEERLTGHLISELAGSLTIAEAAFLAKSAQLYGEPSRLEFHYADMSSNLMERDTGADFALILHVNLPDRPESALVAVCQAKKLYRDGRALAVDSKQLDDLTRWADRAAYYCLYDMDPKRLWAPMMVPCGEIKRRAELGPGDLKPENVLSCSDYVPVSVFLIFNMLVEQQAGRAFESLWAAAEFVTGGRQKLEKGHRSPSRVLLVSIGGATGLGDLRDFHGLFSSPEQ